MTGRDRNRRGGFVPAMIVGACALLPASSATHAQEVAGLLAARGQADARTLAGAAYEIAPLVSEVQVDGRMDESAWTEAVVVPIAYEVDPGDNLPAPVATECRLTYDDHNLYLGCVAHDPRPDRIRAFLTDRDGIDGHDRILLTLDPFHDQRRAFQFGVSALGVQSDAVLAQQGAGGGGGDGGQPTDPAWDAIWNSAGAITEDGYVIEASIPFRTLRFPAANGPRSWGMFLTRWWPRSSAMELRSAPLDRDNSCVLCQTNELTGLGGITPGRALRLTPTLTAGRVDRRPDGGSNLMAGATEPDAGLDAQWGVTSDVTLNLTINPDFSQVEADVAQLDVNSRFALFFPEKRPFFLEGADFFGTPLQAVFTRSIAEPVAGAKVSGKTGSTGLGVLVARDRVNNLLFPSAQSSDAGTLDDEATTTIARVRRDIGGSSSAGALLTTRFGNGYRNVVGGADVFLRPMPSVTVQAQALRSTTEYPRAAAADHGQPDGAFAGDAGVLSVNWSSRDWAFFGQARRIGEGFRADAGFMPQAGIFGRNAMISRIIRGDAGGWFTQIRTDVGFWRQSDGEGHVLDGGHWVGLMYRGPAQTSFGIWPNFVRKHHAGHSYEGMLFTFFDLGARPRGDLSLGVNAGFGDDIDFANGGVGEILRLSPHVTVRAGRHVEAEASHSYQRLDREGARVFTANLSRLRAVYSFSARSFVRAVLQRQQVVRNPDRHAAAVSPESAWRFVQLTYGYKVDPQTVLFLGYGEDRRGGTDPYGIVEPVGLDARSFFLKLGWAWQP